MEKILSVILKHKVEEILRQKRLFPLKDLVRLALASGKPKGFVRSIRKRSPSIPVIAEIKRSSPKRMLMPVGFDPVGIARGYEKNGAAALSVLTDARFFGGSPLFIPLVREAVSIPVLRKEFVLDEYQVYESRLLGADAVLLMVCNFLDPTLYRIADGLKIGRAVSSSKRGGGNRRGISHLSALVALAKDLSLDPLVEVHNREELDVALSAGAKMIGINNRNLNSPSLAVDLQTTGRLLPYVPKEIFVVSESGYKRRGDLATYRKQGVDAFLIGSSLMEHPDPGKKLRSLLRP